MTNISPSSPHYAALQEFLKFSLIKTYPAKCNIMKPGDIGDHLYFIIDGAVSISYKSPEGQELILAYLNKGDFIGEIGVFKDAGIRSVSVDTRSRCQMAEMPYVKLRAILKNEMVYSAADFLFLLSTQLSSRLLTTSRKCHDLAFLDVEGRVARALMDLCAEPEAVSHPEGMQIYISRQEISRIAGCSREMVGRILKELEDKNLIKAHGKTITVLTPLKTSPLTTELLASA
ncbi:MAG: cyclic nucleotide-binding domain-containing protein [Methylococcaceae bacterium]|nr:cyclic nucleotide-binding domain-containing protein [Methylococcaceae bacterium]